MHDITIRWGERSARRSPGEAITVGRDPSSALVIDDPAVAGHHLVLAFEDDFWVVRDRSGGATAVDGRHLAAVRVERDLDVHLGPPGGPRLRLEPDIAGPPGEEALHLTLAGDDLVVEPGRVVTIGTAPECDLRADSPLVSAHHCRFAYDGAGWVIEDVGSARGTFIDHRRVTRPTPVQGAFYVSLGDDDAGEQLRVVTAGEHRVRRPRAPLVLGAAGLVLGALALLLVLTDGGDGGPTPVAAPLPTPAVEEPTASPAQIVPADELAAGIVRPVLTLPDGQACSSGSGTHVGDGLVLTNFHVVGVLPGAPPDCRFRGDIAIALAPDRPTRIAASAEIVAIDPAADLAVLRLGEMLDLPVIPLSIDQPAIGSRLRIFGYPGIGGGTLTVTSGEVSGFLDDPNVGPGAWIKTDATIAGGNSGGAAINDAGELVGVPTIVGAGGTTQAVECRPLADTNGDGRLDGTDTCVSVGGFLNGVRPARLAEELIRAASGAAAISFDDPSLDLNAVDANADFDRVRIDGLRIDGFDADGDVVALDGDVQILCATYSYGGIDQGLVFTSAWVRDSEVINEGYLNGFWGAGPEGETTSCYRPLGGVVPGDYLFGIAFGLDFDASYEAEERVG